MTKEQEDKILEKAQKWVYKRVKGLPSYLQTQVIEDELYCAYLEGAGIITT